MSSHEGGSDWFLVQLKPNSARVAERNLNRQGFRTFLPLEEVTKRVRSQFVSTEQPLFPGYMFVALDVSGEGWRAVNSTLGVSRLVSFGQIPAPVPQDIISGLMARSDDGGNFEPQKSLLPGDAVKVTRGPFADFLAEIESIEPDARVWILMDLISGKQRVSLPAEQLRAV